MYKRFILMLFVIVNIQIQARFDNKTDIGVLKDAIVEMNNSFPAPHNPAASPETKGCRRAHQGLYNELVVCAEQNEDQVKIFYDDVIYGFDTTTQEKRNSFWIYRKHLVSLKELSEEVINAIPHPKYAEEPTVVLIYPWKHFSVGTRFKRAPNYDNQSSYAIKLIDYAANTVKIDFIPSENVLLETKQDAQSSRKLFAQTTNNLVDRVTQSGNNNVIMYVWGGSSFVWPYIQSNFFQENGVWQRSGENSPYSGYDCAEFVMRMAKIAGSNFPWKTTAVIERMKRPLGNEDQLEEGDLIWFQGHVMIVSNIKNNEIIEARGYSSGYGCVQRISLSECFDGIVTYDDLLARYRTNQPLKVKDKNGVPSEQAKPFKILKFVD